MDCKMKKSLFFLIVLFNCCCFFSVDFVKNANTNTAVRCLKIAENCLLEKNWNEALVQAEQGLTYDDSISDLMYVKAVAQINQNLSLHKVLETIKKAFELENWVSYTKNRARIFYADLLSDTDMYEMSLSILDDESFLYSADAEFIRVKNYYRMGTAESWGKARTKIEGARRVYPADMRFPQIFFLFEGSKKMQMEKLGQKYLIPDYVQKIADSYIDRLPDNTKLSLDDKIFASYFADKNLMTRLISAIEARTNEKNALLAVAGLYTGLYSAQNAFDMFFETAGESISLDLLDFLIYATSDFEVRKQIAEKMLNYNGSIVIDTDGDFQNELSVKYETGRPQYITFDKNNDGINELYCACDFGSPVYISYENEHTEVNYENYPNVSKIFDGDMNYTYHFLFNDFVFVPFNFINDVFLYENGIEFLIPQISNNVVCPKNSLFYNFVSKLEYSTYERANSKVIYSLRNGDLISADFFEDTDLYANCNFESGKSFVRFVDYDNDGIFETSEVFDYIDKDSSEIISDKILVNNIFGALVDENSLYLKKIMIDRNANTNYEFSEEYLEADGRIDCWDYDDNGIIDCQYILYPHNMENAIVEETVFFNDNGLPFISLSCIDSIPVKMNYNEREVPIYAGEQQKFYWIEENGSFVMEDFILRAFDRKMEQGIAQILEFGSQRISVIRIGSNIYAKIIPDSYVEEEQQDK